VSPRTTLQHDIGEPGQHACGAAAKEEIMGVLLQGFFKMRPNLAVPSPADGDRTIPWWWDRLAEQAGAFRDAGFSAVWLPPVLKTSAGAKSGSDGYGPFDDYDIGSKNQMGTVPTRFGNREQLQRCVASMRASGLDVYLDMVEHHRDGDPGNFVFRYRGADGTPDIGRFPKNPDNFRPNVPQDPHLGGPPADDFMFGRELAPINGKPPHYVFDNLIDAADWVTRRGSRPISCCRSSMRNPWLVNSPSGNSSTAIASS
jgi:alpha-amylase